MHRLCFVAAMTLVAACGPAEEEGAVSEDALRSSAYRGYVVPILLVPSDRTISNADYEKLKANWRQYVLRWYDNQLGSYRIRDAPWLRIDAPRTARYYRDNIWGEVGDLVRDHHGIDIERTGVVIFGVGLRGWAGGNASGGTGASRGGRAIFGTESLLDRSDCPLNSETDWWCRPGMWRGTVIHEIGHMLGVGPHSIAPSIMEFHDDFKGRTLLSGWYFPEKENIQSSSLVYFDSAKVAGTECNWNGYRYTGTCEWTSASTCPGGDFQSGLCAGPTNLKCCVRR
jgi:hypothetical protein